MEAKAISISKPDKGAANEDAAIARGGMIAVADGAGGGGVYAERWSRYLLENLPQKPITDYAMLDGWVDGIWEKFYNKYEKRAKQEGGMFLDKFYDEGSFSTLAAVWRTDEGCKWLSYGDSVAFCYNKADGTLQHSFTELADFNKPPYLINCKDPLKEEGCRTGAFDARKGCIIMVASDTLAHYILMMYEACHQDAYGQELETALNAHSKNSNFIKSALATKADFYDDVLKPLVKSTVSKDRFRKHIDTLRRQELIGFDDYSLAVIK